MAIKTRVGTPLIDVLAADTTLLNPSNPNTREAVTALSLHNTAVGNVIVTIYESPDLTSASGSQVARYEIAANSSEDVVECIDQSYPQGSNLVAVADSTGVNAKITVTQYTGLS